MGRDGSGRIFGGGVLMACDLSGLKIDNLSPDLEIEFFPGVSINVGGIYDRRTLTHSVEVWRHRHVVETRWPGCDRDGGAFCLEFCAADYLRSIGILNA